MQSRYIAIILVLIAIVAAVGLFIAGTSNPAGEQTAIVPEAPALPATVAVTSVSAQANTASAAEAGSNGRIVSWTSSNFPADARVNVNLIRKVSDSPVAYDFVRTIAANVANSGQATWSPAENELGEDGADLYIEVVCADPSSFGAGCSASGEPAKAF